MSNDTEERIEENNRPSDPMKESLQKNVQVRLMPFGLPMAPDQRTKPIVQAHNENTDQIDEYIESPEIQRLRWIMIERKPQNMRWIYNHTTACKAAGYTKTQATIGPRGLECKSKDESFSEFVKDYLREIKYRNIILQATKDNDIHADSVFYLDYNDEKNMIIPRWINYVTLTAIPQKYTGGKKWVQVTHVDSQLPKNEGAKWKQYQPYVDYYHDSPYFQDSPRDKMIVRHLYEDEVLNFKFYTEPPIIGFADVCLWLKWMEYDAMLGGKKYATPNLDVSVDDDDLNLQDDETWTLMNRISQDVNKMMNFGNIAHPKRITITPLQMSGQVFNFTQYLEYAEKVVYKGMMVPSGLMDSRGTELATSKTVKDIFIIGINANRHFFVEEFERLVKLQAEFVGRKVPKDFQLVFSEDDNQQQMTHSEEFNALLGLWNAGILRDENEVRDYVKRKFNMDLDQLTDDEIDMRHAEQMQQSLIDGGIPGLDGFDQIEKDIEDKMNDGKTTKKPNNKKEKE